MQRERRSDNPAATVLGEAARVVLSAVRLLVRKYILVVTNVPYLGMRSQSETLFHFLETNHSDAKSNLATAFGNQCLALCVYGGTVALVTPQNWLYQSSYADMRRRLLTQFSWDFLARLGVGAFTTVTGEVVNVFLGVITNSLPNNHVFYGIDCSLGISPDEKEQLLWSVRLRYVAQSSQLENPECRITLEPISQMKLLEDYAIAPQGIKTGDDDRWRRYFWEIMSISSAWRFYQSTATTIQPFGGRESILDWATQGSSMIRPRLGNQAVGKCGTAIKQIGALEATLFTGELYDSNVAAIVPNNPSHLPALWAFCSSAMYNVAVREIDKGWKVSNVPLTQVPFDLDYWQKVAEERYPTGLPEPYSNNPNQWLFNGHPAGTTHPLQVAVARLLGYRWPQNGDDDLSTLADSDGIVCLPPVAGEQPAHDRLRALLAHAYSHPPQLPDFELYRVGDFVPATPVDPADGWSAATQARLLAAVGYGGKGLDEWLRDGFFEQHCKLFQNRPFIWHIWDGRKDGFSALVNYHKLDAATLDKLIYTYLGHWISAQRAAVERGEAGADGRLVAALELQKKLELIRTGEDPYDLYIRWKPLHQQPIGWQPDLNDGVRLNCRPWVTAGVFRKKFTINWNTDRGKNPDGSDRVNDRHFSRAEKEAARQQTVTK